MLAEISHADTDVRVKHLTDSPVPALHHVADSKLGGTARMERNFADAVKTIERAWPGLEAADRATRPKRGPKPDVSFRTLLILMQFNALSGGDPTMESVCTTGNTLPRKSLAKIGLHTDRGLGIYLKPHTLAPSWRRLIDAISGAEYRPGRRADIDTKGNRTTAFRPVSTDARGKRPELSFEQQLSTQVRELGPQGLHRGLTVDERERRAQLGLEAVNAIVRAAADPALCSPIIAMDWTDHESFADTYRREVLPAKHTASPTSQENAAGTTESTPEANETTNERRIAQASADSELAWGRRSPKKAGKVISSRGRTIRNGKDKGKGAVQPPRDVAHALLASTEWEDSKNQFYFGGILFGSAGAPSVANGPEYMLDVELRPANLHAHAGVYPGQAIERLRGGGFQIDVNIVDRGYSQYDQFHDDAAEQGVAVYYDVKDDQLGFRGSVDGAPLLNGGPACPGVADDAVIRAIALTRPPPPNASRRIRRDKFIVFREGLERLHPFMWQVQGDVGPDLHALFICPARAFLVRCPLFEPSMSLPYELPEIIHPPADRDGKPLKCCAAGTVELTREVGVKIRQRDRLYGPEWEVIFDKRGVIERAWSKGKGSHRLRGDEINVLGIAARQLFTAIGYAAANIEATRAYAAENPEYAAPTLADPKLWHPNRPKVGRPSLKMVA